MGTFTWGFIRLMGYVSLCVLLLSQSCTPCVPMVGTITPGFHGSQMSCIDKNGLFLSSNDSNFALGFQPKQDNVTSFLLVIVHTAHSTVVWTANTSSNITNADEFEFSSEGKVSLSHMGNDIWSPVTNGTPVSTIQLLNSGNLVLYGKDNAILWQSFSHPTDTLLPNQVFSEGMRLSSDSSSPGNLTYFLEIKSGDMILSAGFQTPQPYWSVATEPRSVTNIDGGVLTSAMIDGISWKFYDKNKALLRQFIFSTDATVNSSWIAVLGDDGSITFSVLQTGITSPTFIPKDQCGKPEACKPYLACSLPNQCNCPSGLLSRGCNVETVSHCESNYSTELVNAGDGLDYFALKYVHPYKETDLNSCKQDCASNCSCVALFFDNSSSNCFLFSSIGSFQSSTDSKVSAYVKVSMGTTPIRKASRSTTPILLIAGFTFIVIAAMLYGGYRYYLRNNEAPPPPLLVSSDDDDLVDSLSTMPVRYCYKDLEAATDNFSVKLGHGGFGSVYQGVLPDGTRLAVKKLEGVSQGKKEFRAEVSIIGSIHHVHLVRLKGFCSEGSHRLLAYEYMANGSLDKWIFKKDNREDVLDWETRYRIALGTAKGLAYLHEDCDAKIIHCDIKPENVLLDDHFQAKVSDFGLAKLMTREQSLVCTTLRGTRGYLAPEWLTNCAISEKSDVYSYGMVLLEIIGGRKNYDPNQTEEKSHFPSYAFKMMEEGKVKDLLDSALLYDPCDDSVSIAIQVALWCIQEDMSLRPPMTKVVQMLEGVCTVPPPPPSSPLRTRLYNSVFKLSGNSTSDTRTSYTPSDYNSETFISAVRLSGPR